MKNPKNTTPSNYFLPTKTLVFIKNCLSKQTPPYRETWIARTALHNIGNSIQSLLIIFTSIQDQISSKNMFLFHEVFAHLVQTLRITETLLSEHHISKQKVSLNDCLSSAINILTPELKQEAITLHYTPSKQLLCTLGNYNVGQQIFINILKNAIEALQKKPPQTKSITIYFTHHKTTIGIHCIDTGPGFPAKKSSISNKSPQYFLCRGLGLEYVKHNMRRVFDGTVTTENTPSSGAHVSLYFPRAPEIATIAP